MSEGDLIKEPGLENANLELQNIVDSNIVINKNLLINLDRLIILFKINIILPAH